MKAKVQIRHNLVQRFGRWLVGAALAASMATPALAVRVQGPAQVTDPVYLDPDVVITILDTVDGLLSLLDETENDRCKKACNDNCKGEVERANCYADFSCNSTNPSPGDTVRSSFKRGFYVCDGKAREKKTSDGGLGQIVPNRGE